MALLRYESQVRPSLVEGDKDYHQISEDICRPVEARPHPCLVDRVYRFCLVPVFRNFICYNGGDLWYRPVEPEQNCGMGLWTSPTLYGGSV
jgi:hypothetical protein